MQSKPTLVVMSLGISWFGFSQEPDWPKLFAESQKTEVYAPVPPVVTPAETVNGAPSDAVILFDGKNLDAWKYDASEPPGETWSIQDGVLIVNKKAGGIVTKELFTDYQLHLEYRIPTNISGEGQNRGNSGVFLAYLGMKDTYFEEGYELQILDNYNNSTYVNGQAGSVYKQAIPLANACKKPGEWQTYDIIWQAPRFKEDGALDTPAYVTLIHNGVLVQNHAELKGQTVWIGEPYYSPHGPAPIRLQSHPDPSEPVSFRNIWLREL